VLLATLICSDEACAAEAEVPVFRLDELDDAACECGCTFVLLAVAEWTPARVPVPALLLALAA
jgi:hypothetical protein